MPSIIIAGKDSEELYRLGKRTIVIGRDVAATAQVVDPLVSRRHLQIRYDADRDAYLALDMKSENGTFINGRRIEGETELADGDTIEIGGTLVHFTTKDFPDRKSAIHHWHQARERGRSTIHRPS